MQYLVPECCFAQINHRKCWLKNKTLEKEKVFFLCENFRKSCKQRQVWLGGWVALLSCWGWRTYQTSQSEEMFVKQLVNHRQQGHRVEQRERHFAKTPAGKGRGRTRLLAHLGFFTSPTSSKNQIKLLESKGNLQGFRARSSATMTHSDIGSVQYLVLFHQTEHELWNHQEILCSWISPRIDTAWPFISGMELRVLALNSHTETTLKIWELAQPEAEITHF